MICNGMVLIQQYFMSCITNHKSNRTYLQMKPISWESFILLYRSQFFYNLIFFFANKCFIRLVLEISVLILYVCIMLIVRHLILLHAS